MVEEKKIVPIGIVILYFATHLLSLISLPVFADESIYIRWAQLIMDNWHQYLFFPLNDGKTPLFIWSLIPFQLLFTDQLFAGRIVSVLIGFGQMFVTKHTIALLGGRAKAQWLGMLMIAILPFWYIYHRLALMDGMLTFLVSLTILATLKIVKTRPADGRRQFKWTVMAGVSLGLAILTKLPAIFLIPGLFFFPLLRPKLTKPQFRNYALAIGGSTIIGLAMLAVLRISPSFSQIFRRSSDFTFPISEVLFRGRWLQTIPNIPNYLWYFFRYLTWPVLLLSVIGLFTKKNRRLNLIMLILMASLSGVFFLFGKVVYSRYFLPVAIPITVMACLNAQVFYDRFFNREELLHKKAIAAVVITILLGSMISGAFEFLLPSLTDPITTPYVSSDTEQYLTTWSAGIGIPETVAYIHQQSQQHTIAVATEGSFGTLPDGILLYFHNRDLSNIYIEGTAEYPVKSLPSFFTKRAKTFDQSILVVNSDRMQLPLPKSSLLAQYCRPYAAPCLQIWDITQQVKAAP